jgi:hypothetical protein
LNRDLHGNAPDKSADALLMIDVINDLAHRKTKLVCFRKTRGSKR